MAVFQGIVSYREYLDPPPAEGVPNVPLPPVCPYILPTDPAEYYNAFHEQCEAALRQERKDIHDALLRPIGMTIDNLTPDIPGQFIRQQAAGEPTRILVPRLILQLHSEHEKKMDRVCRLTRRLNNAIRTMREQQERVLSVILPLLPQVPDPAGPAGAMMADVDRLVTPIVREYMPGCSRASCAMCLEFDG